MSTKLTLTAKPTFQAVVSIPVAGGAAANVLFTFKHRTRAEFKTFIDGLDGREDIKILMDIASGWDLDEAFDEAAIERMLELYMGSATAIITTYVSELTGARTKN